MFGQDFLEQHELLFIGIGKVSDLNSEQMIDFCSLANIQQCTPQDINKYLLDLKPKDFVENMKTLQNLGHDEKTLMDVLDANLNFQSYEIQHFRKILQLIKTFAKKIRNPETKKQILQITF